MVEKEKETPKCLPSPHLDTTGQPVETKVSVEEYASRGPGVHVCKCTIYARRKNERREEEARERRFCWPLDSGFLCLRTTTTPPQLFLPSEQSRATGPQPIEFQSSFFNYYYFQVIGAFQSFEFRRQDFLTFPSSLHKRVGSNLYKCKSPPGVQVRFIMQFRFVFFF